MIYSTLQDEGPIVAERNCVGSPHYTMTVADGRLFARMGSPVTCPSNMELRLERASDLVCLDLAREGKLLWKLAAHELFPDEIPWRYEGTPAVLGGRAYVTVCRRHPQLELMVACLDASDGRLLWQRPVGSFRTSVDDSQNRISHLLLTTGGGRIFLSSDAGTIVALDAQDGRLEWAVSYETRNDETMAVQRDPTRKGLLPALYHSGFLFVAPRDANSAFCIEADSGRVHWQLPYVAEMPAGITETQRRGNENRQQLYREWRHLLGVVPGGQQGRLVVSGNSLLAIDIATGRLAWSSNEGAMGRGNKAIFGRGLITDQQIFLPTRESIEIYDSQSGAQTRSIPLKTPDSDQQGGNLILAGGMLLVAQPGRLAAYGEFSLLKERLEKDLTRRPDSHRLRLQLAELEATEGQFEVAQVEFRRLLVAIDPTDPLFHSGERSSPGCYRKQVRRHSVSQNRPRCASTGTQRWTSLMTCAYGSNCSFNSQTWKNRCN